MLASNQCKECLNHDQIHANVV